MSVIELVSDLNDLRASIAYAIDEGAKVGMPGDAIQLLVLSLDLLNPTLLTAKRKDEAIAVMDIAHQKIKAWQP